MERPPGRFAAAGHLRQRPAFFGHDVGATVVTVSAAPMSPSASMSVPCAAMVSRHQNAAAKAARVAAQCDLQSYFLLG